MAVKDFLKAQHILGEADFGEDAELFKSALPHMHFVKEMFQVEDVENLNLSRFAKGVCLILEVGIKEEKPLKDFCSHDVFLQFFRANSEATLEAFKVNKTLTKLDLPNNIITDVGAQAIAEILKVNKTVTAVDLRVNEIGDDGAKAIAEALKVNKTVTWLGLSGNLNISGVGAWALEAVKKLKEERGEKIIITGLRDWDRW